MPSRNLETVHRLMNRSDFDDLTSDKAGNAAREAYAPYFEVHQPPSFPEGYGGVHKGPEAWQAMHETMRTLWHQTLTIEHIWDLPEHDVVILYARHVWTSKATGKSATWPAVQVLTFEDGRIVKMQNFHQDTKLILDTLQPS